MAWQWTDAACSKCVDNDFKKSGFFVKSCYLYTKRHKYIGLNGKIFQMINEIQNDKISKEAICV